MRLRPAPALTAGALAGLCLVLPAAPALARGGPPGGTPPPRPVRAQAVVREPVRDEVTVVGSVEPRLYTKVAARVEGVVETLHVTEGTEVDERAPLATLERRPLELKHAAATARLDVAKERLRLLQAGEREEVRAGARAAVAEAEAR
ncbi:MAG: biotin/lipoyl-binding protein, partial [Planctomycetia bacterium]|nr:biotin/lipoyl-binding protein [Planctomycetia bacterium]